MRPSSPDVQILREAVAQHSRLQRERGQDARSTSNDCPTLTEARQTAAALVGTVQSQLTGDQNLICAIVIVTGRCNFKPAPEEQSLRSDSVFEDENEHSEVLLLHRHPRSAAAVNTLAVIVTHDALVWRLCLTRGSKTTAVRLCFCCVRVGVGKKGDCGRLQGKQDGRRESRLWR